MKKTFIYAIVFALSFLLNSFQYPNFKEQKSSQIIKSQESQQNKGKYLIGRWIIPHNADINITFNVDGTFVFVDFDLKLYKEEILKGKYVLNGDKLTLNYSDRAKQNFIYYKGNSGDSNYYIKKKGYYFVKAN